MKNEQHLFLSMIDTLTTQVAILLCNLEYGSRIFDLMDRPKNNLLLVRMLYLPLQKRLIKRNKKIAVNQATLKKRR